MTKLEKFWYGKINLWKSYWIVGELINAFVIIIIFNIEIKYFNNLQLFEKIPFVNFSDLHFLNKFFFTVWSIFITVGIWRSAENYKGRFIWVVLTLIILSYRLFTLKKIFY